MTDNEKSGLSGLVNKEDLEYDKALRDFALNVQLDGDDRSEPVLTGRYHSDPSPRHPEERSDEESFSLLLKVADLVEDKLALYDLLADESEGGNALALDVMNEIWPPENIIEED